MLSRVRFRLNIPVVVVAAVEPEAEAAVTAVAGPEEGAAVTVVAGLEEAAEVRAAAGPRVEAGAGQEGLDPTRIYTIRTLSPE